MPKTFYPHEKKFFAPSLCDLLNPIHAIPGGIPLLLARGNKPLELSFEQQLNALVYFHLEEHTSGCHLIQCIDEDDFARDFVSGSKGIKKSTLQYNIFCCVPDFRILSTHNSCNRNRSSSVTYQEVTLY